MKLRAIILLTFMLVLAIPSGDTSKNPNPETTLVAVTTSKEYTKAQEKIEDKDDMPPSAQNDDMSDIAELPDGMKKQIVAGIYREIVFN